MHFEWCTAVLFILQMKTKTPGACIASSKFINMIVECSHISMHILVEFMSFMIDNELLNDYHVIICDIYNFYFM